MSHVGSTRRLEFLPQTLLAKAVFRLDRHLQSTNGVFCYSSDPKCIFRMSLMELQSPVALNCWTTLPAGTTIADLHIWNEQLPALAEHDSLIAWALSFSRNLAHSLRLLSAYLAQHREFDCIRAIRADMALGTTEMTERLLSLSGRYGFIPCSDASGEASMARRFGENILISMMLLARNAGSFRLSTLRRTRVLVFMPRQVLDARFGPGSRPRSRPLS